MRYVMTVMVFLLGWGLALAEPLEAILVDIDGKTQKLSDYRGKWVVVNYWATWCPPCLDEIPDLVEFHEKHKDRNAVVLGVNFEDVDSQYLLQFIEEYFISYPVFTADPSANTPFGPVYGLPSTFLVSPAGELVASRTGSVTLEDLEGAIREHQPVQPDVAYNREQ